MISYITQFRERERNWSKSIFLLEPKILKTLFYSPIDQSNLEHTSTGKDRRSRSQKIRVDVRVFYSDSDKFIG